MARTIGLVFKDKKEPIIKEDKEEVKEPIIKEDKKSK